jgi:hypothetical protein
MHLSEAAITWGREDHPPLMPSHGEYAVVLVPIMRSDMHTCRFSCVLIDGGSNIKLLYRSSMEKLDPACLVRAEPAHLPWHLARAFVHPYGLGAAGGSLWEER